LAAIIAGTDGKFERVTDNKLMDCVKVLKFIDDILSWENYCGRSKTIVSVYENVLEIVISSVPVNFDWTILLFDVIEAGWKGAAFILLIVDELVSIRIPSGHWECTNTI